jgi:MoxR-like ATPase
MRKYDGRLSEDRRADAEKSAQRKGIRLTQWTGGEHKRISANGNPYIERITVARSGERGSFYRVRERRDGKIAIESKGPLSTITNDSPWYTGVITEVEEEQVSKGKVPYAAPPKYGPDQMDPKEWRKQMDAHRAWLDSEKQGTGTSGETTDDAPPAAQDDDRADDANEGEGEEAQEEDSTVKGKYNVYCERAGEPGKAQRVAQGIEAESASDAKRQARAELAPTKWDLSTLDARRQRGKPMQTGQDKRRHAYDSQSAAKAGSKGTRPSQGKGQGTGSAQDEFDAQQDAPAGQSAEDLAKALDEALQQAQQEQQGEGGGSQQDGDLLLQRLNAAPLIGEEADARINSTVATQVREQVTTSGKLLYAALVEAVQGAVASALEGLDLDVQVDESKVLELVRGEIEKQGPARIEIVKQDGETVTIEEHTHPLFERVMRLATARQPVYLFGPSGTGKTHLAEQCARALGLEFFALSATMGMSESHLQGWRLPLDGGTFVYVPSEFVKLYENGGVFLLDEADRSDPNVLAVLNQALANKRMPVPARFEAPVAKMHPDFVMMAAGNTAGTGSDRLYSAATRLDEAFLDRFRAGTLYMDYDRKLEESLVGKTDVLEALWTVRDRIKELRMERVVSTRYIIEVHRLGYTVSQALSTLTVTWDENEREKCGIKTTQGELDFAGRPI